MKKIFVDIFIPALDRNFNIELPINLEMKYVIDNIQNALIELTDGAYLARANVKIYDKNTGCLINTNNIVKYSGLKNGSSVLWFNS